MLLRLSAGQYRVAFERIRCGIARRLGLDVELLKSAASVVELHPGEMVAGPPCIALASQYERVRACPYGIRIADEVAQLQGAPRPIGPTVRYTLHDVVVDRGVIYGRGRRKFFNHMVQRSGPRQAWTEHEEVVLRSSFVGCHFFGHWLRDDCATHLLAERESAPMSMPTPPWPDRVSYLALFGQRYVELSRSYVRRLVLFDDISQNAHKVERLRPLRARVAQAHTSFNAGRIVYLKRGPGGKLRTLLNEAEIVEALERRGVTIVQAETLGATQLIEQLLGARIVISVEGSQLSHALFTLGEGGGLLAIHEPYRFINPHMDWARPLNMKYGIVISEQRDQGFYLSADDLLRTIDLMDAELL